MAKRRGESATARSLHSERARLRDDLITESDRAVSLITAAYLDDALASLIRGVLVDDHAAVEKLLGIDRPLSTFSSRIRMAYCLGQISRATLRDLELIRAIRNEFAHSRSLLTFETPRIRQRSLQLRCAMITEGPRRPDFANSRVRFLESTLWLGNVLRAQERLATRLSYPADRA